MFCQGVFEKKLKFMKNFSFFPFDIIYGRTHKNLPKHTSPSERTIYRCRKYTEKSRFHTQKDRFFTHPTTDIAKFPALACL